MIEINKIGLIKSGENQGWQIKVEDDSKDIGGYFVLISKDFSNPDAEAYDDWVENKTALEKYFKESKLNVEWN